MSEARDVAVPGDTEYDGWSTPEFTVRSASIRGANHRFHRKPRQDSARVAVHEASGSIVFAVADGGSGATDSHVGAVEASQAAVERILHLLSQGAPMDFESIAHHAAERLRHVTASRHATTLVAGVVHVDASGPKAELCRIGNSGAWLLDRATGSYHALFGTKAGSDTEPISNAAVRLPHVPDSVEAVAEHLTASEVLLIGTDGFGDPLGDGAGPVGTLFARHLAVPPTPLQLAHVLDFSRETFDDDRTLVAVWPIRRG